MKFGAQSMRPAAVSLPGATGSESLGEHVARRWLVGLLAARPLEESGAMPLALFAARAPGFCACVLQALQEDGALEQIEAGRLLAGEGPTLRIGDLLGSASAVEIVAAVDSLQSALWQEVVARLAGEPAAELAAAAERLAHVVFRLLVAELAAERSVAPTADDDRREPAADQGDWGGSAGGPEEMAEADRVVAGTPAEPARSRSRRPLIQAHAAPEEERLQPLEDGWEIDVRPEQSPAEELAAWRGGGALLSDKQEAIGDRSAPPGVFAVLLLELAEGRRLGDALGAQAEELIDAVGRLLTSAMSPGQRISAEAGGRWWLLAPETDMAGARELASGLAQQVRAGLADRSVPLELAIGIAIGGGDEQAMDELAVRAEADLFSARAAGLPVAPAG